MASAVTFVHGPVQSPVQSPGLNPVQSPVQSPGLNPALGAAVTVPRVELDSVEPALAQAGSPATIRGRVTAGSTALSAPQVVTRVAPDRVVSRAEVERWAALSGAVAPTGRTVAEAATSAGTGTLAPGATATFAVTIPADVTASMSGPYGTLALALSVSERPGAGPGVTLRTFLPVFRRKEFEPLTLGWVAPLTLGPDAGLMSAEPQTKAAAWVDALGPGSRVDRLLTGLAQAEVTLVVDPSTIDPVTEVSAPSASTSPGAASSTAPGSPGPTSPADPNQVADTPTVLAADLGQRLAQVGGHTVWTLPRADTDLTATAVSASSSLVRDLLAAPGSSALPTATRTRVVWPPDGAWDPVRERKISTLYGAAPLALVSSSVFPGRSGYTTTAVRRTGSGTTLLGWDDGLSALMVATGSRAAGALTLQRFIAETAAVLGEEPGVSRQLLVAIPRSANPNGPALARFMAALETVPWLTSAAADDLVAAGARAEVVAPTASAWATTAVGEVPSVLTSARLASLTAQRATFVTVASVVKAGSGFAQHWQDVADELTSVRWRSAPSAWEGGEASLSAAVRRATRGLRVLPQQLNFLADSGALQVTIVNELDDEVSGLRLVLEPANARMRITSAPAVVTIAGRSRVTLRVQALAVASGLVPILAWLTTADGTRVGEVSELTVRANPPSPWIYWLAGGAGGLVFLAGVVRSVRRSGRTGQRGRGWHVRRANGGRATAKGDG